MWEDSESELSKEANHGSMLEFPSDSDPSYEEEEEEEDNSLELDPVSQEEPEDDDEEEEQLLPAPKKEVNIPERLRHRIRQLVGVFRVAH